MPAAEPVDPVVHPVIAVLDKRSSGQYVVWHVQTSPDAPSASGVLSGAWVLGAEEVAPGRLADLLRGTVVLPVAEVAAAAEELAPGRERTSLAGIAAAMKVSAEQVKQAAKEAKAANKALQLPALAPVNLPDPAELVENYHGEPIADRAWAYATAAAELVEQWHGLEGQRRGRRYLQERFGSAVRPLPMGQ